MNYDSEIVYLRTRIKELERQVEHLRLSRRVLMNLIEKLEREKKSHLNQLEKEKKRLQLNNQKYAQLIMKNNFRFIELLNSYREKTKDNNEEKYIRG